MSRWSHHGSVALGQADDLHGRQHPDVESPQTEAEHRADGQAAEQREEHQPVDEHGGDGYEGCNTKTPFSRLQQNKTYSVHGNTKTPFSRLQQIKNTIPYMATQKHHSLDCSKTKTQFRTRQHKNIIL